MYIITPVYDSWHTYSSLQNPPNGPWMSRWPSIPAPRCARACGFRARPGPWHRSLPSGPLSTRQRVQWFLRFFGSQKQNMIFFMFALKMGYYG